jgi:hypothetical protein
MAVRKYYPETIDDAGRREGYHKMPLRSEIDDEYVPVKNAEKRFVQAVRDKVNKKISNLPDHDTGYLFVDKDAGPYTIKHNLGAIPSRLSAYFCTDEEPVDGGKSTIHWVRPVIIDNVGFTLSFDNSNQCTITTASTYIQGTNATGYLRLMFWR